MGRSTMRPARLGGLLLTMILLLGGTAAGCSGEEGTAGDGAVGVDHAYGHVDLPENPESVVSLVPGYTDALLALGSEPSAVTGFAGFASPVLPWEEGRLKVAPEGPTEVFEMLNPSYVPVEQIAELQPDAVLASSMASDEDTYDQLSRIAPTVAALQPAPALDDWREQTRVVGRMLGDPDRAEEEIGKVDEVLDGVEAEHPGVEGATVAVALYGGPDNIQVVTDPDDITMKVLSRIGLVIPEQLRNLGGGEGGVQGRLSLENLDQLDADIIILGSLSGIDAMRESPYWGDLTAVKEDRVITLDPAGVTAFRVPTVLSIPWSLDLLRPALATL